MCIVLQRKRFVYSALSTSLLVLPGMITVAALEAYYVCISLLVLL